MSQTNLQERMFETNLLLVRQLPVLLGEDFSKVKVAHLRVQLCIFGPLFHEEAEVWSQGLLGEIWVFLCIMDKKREQFETRTALGWLVFHRMS